LTSASQIALSMLARTAYRAPGPQERDDKPGFREELARQTVKTTPAVSIELSDAARSALLALQEISAARSEAKASANLDPAITLEELTTNFEATNSAKRANETNLSAGPESDRINMADPFAPPRYEQPGSRLNISI